MKCKSCNWIIWNNADEYEICEHCNKSPMIRQIYSAAPRPTETEKSELAYLVAESDRLYNYSEHLDQFNHFHE